MFNNYTYIKVLPISVLMIIIFALNAYARNEKAPTGLLIAQNIAKDKQYRLEPDPDFKYCADKNDLKQLTDGRLTQGRFWSKSSTVGWSKANPVTIEIDLEKISPITGVSYNTAAGSAGVRWPWAVLIFVGQDSADFQYVGNLVDLDLAKDLLESGKYAVHRFWTNKLKTSGRYVKFIVVPNGLYTFVDEVEVFGRPLSAPQMTSDSSTLAQSVPPSQIGDMDDLIKHAVTKTAISRRFETDIASIRDTLGDIGNRKQYEQELDELKHEISHMAPIESSGYTTVFPINDLHRRIFKIQAAVWRQKGFKAITLWQKNRWDMIAPTDSPTGPAPRIQIKMMRNEYRSAAFNISNAGTETAKLFFTIQGLPGGMDPRCVEVHTGLFTDTAKGVPVMAALPIAPHGEKGYSVEIDPGLTRQIWLTFNSKNLSPGRYAGEIKFESHRVVVPMSLKVYPLEFPDKPRLHLGGWDYTNEDRTYDVTPENREALIKSLREHYVDTPWATGSVLPRGRYDKRGNMTAVPDNRNFVSWIRRWPDAENYFVHLNATQKFSRFKMGTPAFNRAVVEWINYWVNQLADLGIGAEKFGLLLVDEPVNKIESDIAIQYAKLIKRAAPDVKVFENVAWTEPWNAPDDLFKYSDILCISLPLLEDGNRKFVRFYKDHRDAGRTFWLYAAQSPVTELDPYGYYRLQPWFAWQFGAKGSCFWAFSDAGGSSSWNEYFAKHGGPYTPVFINNASVTTAKHIEAMREGMEDNEYLCMLRDRIDELESASQKGAELDRAKTLLESAVARVIGHSPNRTRISWQAYKDREAADKVIEEILDVLMLLSE